MNARRPGGLLLALLLVLATACGSGGAGGAGGAGTDADAHSGPDAGAADTRPADGRSSDAHATDAGAADAGAQPDGGDADAGRDAGRDADRDAGRDADRDAGAPPTACVPPCDAGAVCRAGACEALDCAVVRPIEPARHDKYRPGTVGLAFAADRCAADPALAEPLAGLGAEAFAVLENGAPRAGGGAPRLITGGREPYLTLLLDAGAMDETAVEAARGFVDAVMDGSALVRLATFADGLQVRQDFTADAGLVTAALDALAPVAGGPRDLYGAVLAALEGSGTARAARWQQTSGGVTNLGLVVVFTAGADEAGAHTLDDAAAAVSAAGEDVLLLTLGAALPEDAVARLGRSGRAAAQGPEELGAAFAALAARAQALRERVYVLAYCTPQETGEHTARVELVGVETQTSDIPFSTETFASGGQRCDEDDFPRACREVLCGGLLCGACEGDAACTFGLKCHCEDTHRALPDCRTCRPAFTGPSCEECADPRRTGDDCQRCVEREQVWQVAHAAAGRDASWSATPDGALVALAGPPAHLALLDGADGAVVGESVTTDWDARFAAVSDVAVSSSQVAVVGAGAAAADGWAAVLDHGADTPRAALFETHGPFRRIAPADSGTFAALRVDPDRGGVELVTLRVGAGDALALTPFAFHAAPAVAAAPERDPFGPFVFDAAQGAAFAYQEAAGGPLHVHRVDAAGEPLWTWSESFAGPVHLDLAPGGRLIVGDPAEGTLIRIGRSGGVEERHFLGLPHFDAVVALHVTEDAWARAAGVLGSWDGGAPDMAFAERDSQSDERATMLGIPWGAAAAFEAAPGARSARIQAIDGERFAVGLAIDGTFWFAVFEGRSALHCLDASR